MNLLKYIRSLLKKEKAYLLITGGRRVNINIPVIAINYCTESFKDVKTHTGQEFEKTDYRIARFVGKQKTVNPSFAIDLINSVPPKSVKERVVWCDGGGGPTGHPKVYINLDKPGKHICGYCGLRFTKETCEH